MADRPMTAQERRWQAEEDAHTLARAEELKNDAGRLEAARSKASEQAEERQDQADALKKVAGRKGSLPNESISSQRAGNTRATDPQEPSSGGSSSGSSGKPVSFFDNPPPRK